MASTKIRPSFFGENYERYVSELTTEGTIAGEKLTTEERKEGFKKKNSKIDFQNFLEKVLERIPQESKEKITEGGISRVNFDRYDRKISGDTVEKVFSSESTDSTLKTNNIGSTAIVPISQIISPDQFIGQNEEIFTEKVVNELIKESDPDTLIKEVVKETDPDTLINEIHNEVELDNLINEIRNEVEPDTLIKEVVKKTDPDELAEEIVDHVELDNLINEIHNEVEPDTLIKEVVKETDPDTLINEVVKETDPDELAEEIVDHVELDNLINEIHNEVELDNLINEIRNEVEPDTLIKEVVKETDLDTLINEIHNEVEPDTLIKEVVKETDPDTLINEVVKETDPDELAEEIVDHVELDNLINEIRNESTPTSTQKEIVDVSGLIKANNNLLETNQLIEGFIKAYEKEQIEEEKRLFKERDRQKKEKKKALLRAPKISGVKMNLPSVGISGGNILEGLAKFGLFSALAGLVQFIPQIIEFVETLPDRINKFFTEDIPNFITEKFKEFKTFVSDFFNDRFGEVKQFFEDIYTKIDEFTGGRLTEFIDGIKGLGPMIVEKSQEFYKTIDDWTGGRISGAFDWIGTNVITPMGDFFKEKIDYVGTKAGELWTNFSSSFLNFFGDINFELPDLGVTELTSNVLGLEPALEGPDLSGDVVTMGDSIAVGVRGAQRVSADTSMAKEGAGTKEILGNIQREASAGNLQGKTLQLSSGITNTKGDTDTVREQLRAAKEGGATGVQLMGTANEGDYNQNAALQAIAQEDEFKDFVQFQGGFKAGGDKVHPESYSNVAQSLATSRQENIQQRQQSRQGGGGTGFAAPLFDLIASGEGGYNSMNQGTRNGRIVGSTHNASDYLPKNLPEMTVQEVMDHQAAKRLYAAGKYQIVPDTMEDFVARGGVSKSDMYDAATQEKFPRYVLYKKRPTVGKYLDGKAPLNDAIYALSAEFASIGVPEDTPARSLGRIGLPNHPTSFRPKGTTFYGGTGNFAHTGPEKVAAALQKIKGGGSRSPQPPSPSPQPKPVSDILTKSIDQLDSGRSSDQMQNLGTRKVIVPTDKVVPNRDAISVTSRRGQRWGKMHQGTDIAAPSGTPLHAFTDGYITDTGYEGGYGNYIAWKDIYGMEHFYAHLDKIMGKGGDSVKAGSVIGMSGNTGAGTGPHLHWEYGPEGQTGRNGAGLTDPLDKFDYMMPFGSKKIISKPDDAPMPTPTSASAKVSPELGRLKASADSISKPSGRRSGGSVNATTINLPSTERTVPMVSNVQQSSESMMYKPSVSPSNGNDMYKTHTRALFNIVR